MDGAVQQTVVRDEQPVRTMSRHEGSRRGRSWLLHDVFLDESKQVVQDKVSLGSLRSQEEGLDEFPWGHLSLNQHQADH